MTLQPIKKVWLDQKVEKAALTRRLLDRLPGVPVEQVAGLEPVKREFRFATDPVGESKQHLFITEQKAFIRPCPCTPGSVGCGYWTIDLDLNCPFDCSYCILQQYLNWQPLTVAVNRQKLRVELESFFQRKSSGIIRIGTGELADSLALDEMTENSIFLVESFRGQGRFWLELKSKSDYIRPLLTIKPAENVVLSWSLNPEGIIATEEKGTAGLMERLQAAAKAANHGYRVGFHFDPILHYPGWQDDYEGLVAMLFRVVPVEAIAWVSLGSLRFPSALLPLARRRFPKSQIYEQEFIRSAEGKYRYPRPVRLLLYNLLAEMLASYRVEDKIYLCMESAEVWKEFLEKIKRGRQKLAFPFSWLG